jgi:hypothetical protein
MRKEIKSDYTKRLKPCSVNSSPKKTKNMKINAREFSPLPILSPKNTNRHFKVAFKFKAKK